MSPGLGFVAKNPFLPGATRAVKKAVLGYFSGRLDRPVLPGEEGKELAGRLFHY